MHQLALLFYKTLFTTDGFSHGMTNAFQLFMSGPSAITRINASVPDGRTKMRPFSPSSRAASEISA